MPLKITHAILHILQNGMAPAFSTEELDIDSEACFEFINKHVRRLTSNTAAKKATFTAESEIYRLVKSYQQGNLFFKDFSCKLCERLSSIMQNSEIPSADVLVVAFENTGSQYLAVLKLNYMQCFMHRVNDGENQLIKSASVLPFANGKVEEACLIPYDPMILQILEKPYAVNGEEQNYFSGLFLECETELSKKETAELLHQIVEEVNSKYFDDSMETEARLRYALIEEAEESDEDAFMLVGAVSRAFSDHPGAKDEFLSMATEAGIPHEVKLAAPFVRQQFKLQRFRADNGIELKIPAELFDDPDTVQLITNADGSVSITLKNLRKA